MLLCLCLPVSWQVVFVVDTSGSMSGQFTQNGTARHPSLHVSLRARHMAHAGQDMPRGTHQGMSQRAHLSRGAPWLLAPSCAPGALLTSPPSVAACALADVLAPVVRLPPLDIPLSVRILGACPLCSIFHACSLSGVPSFRLFFVWRDNASHSDWTVPLPLLFAIGRAGTCPNS